LKLSKRLKLIADLIENGASVADIGTDHGHLPVYLAQSGLAVRIIASDISSASLAAARKTAQEAGVTESIIFVVAPGLDGVKPADVDTIVIAGVGGETILGILKDAPWTKSSKIRLVLQPQTKIDILLSFLYDSGYVIKQTETVLDRGKLYTAILAAGGNRHD